MGSRGNGWVSNSSVLRLFLLLMAGSLVLLGASAASAQRGAAPSRPRGSDGSAVLPVKAPNHDRHGLALPAQTSAPAGNAAIVPALSSGAMLTDPGCYATYLQENSYWWVKSVPLPFWIDWDGKSYGGVTIAETGQAVFASEQSAMNQYGFGWPADSQASWNGMQSPTFAPMWQGNGTLSETSFGETTYGGQPAFCITWQYQDAADNCQGSPPVYPQWTNVYQMLIVKRNTGYEDFDVVYNYDHIQFDATCVDNTGHSYYYYFGAGWKDPTAGQSTLLPGAWADDLKDGDSNGLVDSSLDSGGVLGRYVWQFRNGKQPPSIPAGQTFGTPGPAGYGAWSNNPSGTQGEPVDGATGSYYTSTTDLSLAGIGVPFTFTRSYNSADPTSGPLGPGWTDNLNASLTVQPDGDVLARSGDGQQMLFTHNADGSFTAPPACHSTLTAVGGGYELVTQDQTHYVFNSAGQLLSDKDRNGEGLTLTYNPDGTLATVVDSGNRTVGFAYSGGLLSQVTLPDGRNTSYSYNGSGQLAQVTDARGGLTKYTYDSGGRLATIVDQNGHTVAQNFYDSNGRVYKQIDADGGVSMFSWDPTSQTSTYTDPRGNSWQDVYSNGVLIDRIDPLGHDTHYEYDAELNVTSVTDPNGDQTSMTYDSNGNMLTRNSPSSLGYHESWTYDNLNDMKSYTDPRGNTTSYGYDANGNLIQVTGPPPTSPVTLYGRDPNGTGLLTSLTDPNGKTTTYGYDGQGNQTSITTPLGEKSTMTYDSSGRLISRVDPRGNVAGGNPSQYTWTYGYDAADDLTTKTDPLGDTTTNTYDPSGNLLSIKDASGHTTQYGYDAANHLNLVTAPDNSQTHYAYDGNGNLVSRTDANNHTTTFGYDVANRLTSLQLPGGQTWTYAYDGNGNRTSVTDPNGNTAGYTYDALNRLTYDGATGASTAYDPDGNPTSVSTSAGPTVYYTYDSLNRLTQTQTGSNVVSYTYDAAGNVASRTYPGNVTASYTYNGDERLQSVTNGAAVTSYGYDPAGNLTQTTLPSGNGYVETRTYDRAGRLVEISNKKGSSVLSDDVLTLDPVGNPLTVVQTGSYPITTNYTYDSRDRLTQVCYQATACTSGSSPFIRWTYDPVGNRLTEARPTGTTSYTYDVDDRMLTSGSTSYGYDANGNETTAGSTTFAYDAANRLTSTTTGRTTTTYTYDGNGNRLSASTGKQASQTTQYVWDLSYPVPQLAEELDGGGTLLRSYLYGNARISETVGGAAYYYHYDPIGSATNVTSATGATQYTDFYEPFGNIRSETKVNKAPANFMKFAGQYLDPTNLYHFGARQYNPATGSFLSPDPEQPETVDPAGSLYAYAEGRPTVVADISGKQLPAFLASGLIGGLVGEAVYLGDGIFGGGSISWSGAAESFGGGFVAGATGDFVASEVEPFVGEVVDSSIAGPISDAVGGFAGGVADEAANEFVNGCVSGSGLLQAGEQGALGQAVGEHYFKQVGFKVRTLRGVFRNQPNTVRAWASAGTAAIVSGGGPSASACSVSGSPVLAVGGK